MLKITFREDEIAALRYWRFYHPDPWVQQKMEALYLTDFSAQSSRLEFMRPPGGSPLKVLVIPGFLAMRARQLQGVQGLFEGSRASCPPFYPLPAAPEASGRGNYG